MLLAELSLRTDPYWKAAASCFPSQNSVSIVCDEEIIMSSILLKIAAGLVLAATVGFGTSQMSTVNVTPDGCPCGVCAVGCDCCAGEVCTCDNCACTLGCCNDHASSAAAYCSSEKSCYAKERCCAVTSAEAAGCPCGECAPDCGCCTVDE